MEEFSLLQGPTPSRERGEKALDRARFLGREAGRAQDRDCVRIDPIGRACQRPLNSGFRFSRKAAIPSFMSVVEASIPKRADSWSSASLVEPSKAR